MVKRNARNHENLSSRKQPILKGKVGRWKEFLPEDFIMSIFVRLPPKALARFRCVNRSLCSSLTDHRFLTKLAIQDSQSSENYKYLCLSLDKILYKAVLPQTEYNILGFLFYGLGQPQPIKFEHPLLTREHTIVGSCNGLFCMVYKVTEFVLLNPFTGDGRKLFRRKWLRSFPISYGFGYDISNEDHKIVRVEEQSRDNGAVVVDIFSVKNDCWNALQLSLPSTFTGLSTLFAIHVSGALHWRALNCDNRIVSFNLGEEKFGELMIPPGDFDTVRIAAISELQGCLCVVQVRNRCYSVWLMKEYGVDESWTNFVTIESEWFLDHILHYPSHPCQPPLCYTKDGRLVIVVRPMQMVVYNPEDQSISTFVPKNDAHRFTKWVPYVKSLVSPYSTPKQNKKKRGTRI